MKFALLLGTSVYIAAQAAAPSLGELGPLAQFGAVGILGWVAALLVGELRRQREEQAATLKAICDRWDGWEKIRHEDSAATQATMLEITAQCARAQATKTKP